MCNIEIIMKLELDFIELKEKSNDNILPVRLSLLSCLPLLVCCKLSCLYNTNQGISSLTELAAEQFST